MNGPIAALLRLSFARPKRKSASTFPVTEVEVISPRRADNSPGRGADQDDFWFGIIPFTVFPDPDRHAGSDGGQGACFGEDFCVGAETDLEVRAPAILLDHRRSELHRFR